MNIREAIQSIMADQFEWVNARVAKVKSVDESALTITVETLDTETILTDVRLAAGEGNSMVIVPGVGSWVIIDSISENDFVVIAYSQASAVKLGDGSFGGLVKVEDLVTKINNLEGQVNDLLSTLQGIVIPLAPSGTYPFAPEFAGMTPLVETEVDELENPDITHGSL